jgi:hypothetical protein
MVGSQRSIVTAFRMPAVVSLVRWFGGAALYAIVSGTRNLILRAK